MPSSASGPSTSTGGQADVELDAAVLRRLQPKAYLQHFLDQGVRPDGRTPKDADARRVERGVVKTAFGSALATVGATSVVCAVSGQVAAPEPARPRAGYLVPNIDLSPLCSPRHRPGAPGNHAQAIASRLRETLLSTSAVDLASLTIHPGDAVWVLYVDVVCLNDAGRLLEASVLAASAALSETSLPEVTYDVDYRTVRATETGRRRLRPPSRPLDPTSFSILGSSVLKDPTAFETGLGDATVMLMGPPGLSRLQNISVVGAISLDAFGLCRSKTMQVQ